MPRTSTHAHVTPASNTAYHSSHAAPPVIAPARRGRPPKVTRNDLINVMRTASWLRIAWVEDIVYGAAATVAGTHKGKLNIAPKQIYKILCTQCELKVSAMPGEASRTRRLARQAAEFALEGIRHQLGRNLGLQEALENLYIERQSEIDETALE